MDRLIRKTKSLNFLQTRPTPPTTTPHPHAAHAVKLEHEIDTMLEELDSMPRVYRYKNPSFLKTFLTNVDERNTRLLNARFSP
jgi:hypothetical protein